MIQQKILSALELVKRTDTIRKGQVAESVNNLKTEILKDPTNINDAYVTLDFIIKVATEVLAEIVHDTMKQIRESGDDEALGMQLIIETTKVPNYRDDKEWAEINRKIALFTDARTKREATLIDIVNSSSVEEAPIEFTTVSTINPTHIIE